MNFIYSLFRTVVMSDITLLDQKKALFINYEDPETIRWFSNRRIDNVADR